MGKKKRREEVVATQRRIYCYYCDRAFDDEKILIQHQKARHFKCHICHKKLSTASGMVIHMVQVHKENITTVPNAKPGKDSVDLEIYGMEGVPGEPSAYADPSKRPRLDGPGGLPMGFPSGMPGGFPPRPPPPPPHLQVPGMMHMRPPPPGPPPRPPFAGAPVAPPHLSAPGGFPPHIAAAPVQPPFGVPPPWAAGGAPGIPVPGVPPPGVIPPGMPGMPVPSAPHAAAPGFPPTTVPGYPYPGAPAAIPSATQGPPSELATELAKPDGMVFYDEQVSMEEKRALRPKYGYKPLATSAH
ncbi:hypothetical protein Poli38472_008651 [Pythium oligandrum]|uniref:Uncharacterized protein n=1 Tax=Pythium oligandrum TaxID=41045 RepID=A0A8K1C452_PYTOL|nr:hypothetical protein Poli38472_008651 [Pythium oligandrum]|eukprot:TMW56003.1 hypothetical protein Poli38472_008651 [Pythium oligandrum]